MSAGSRQVMYSTSGATSSKTFSKSYGLTRSTITTVAGMSAKMRDADSAVGFRAKYILLLARGGVSQAPPRLIKPVSTTPTSGISPAMVTTSRRSPKRRSRLTKLRSSLASTDCSRSKPGALDGHCAPVHHREEIDRGGRCKLLNH